MLVEPAADVYLQPDVTALCSAVALFDLILGGLTGSESIEHGQIRWQVFRMAEPGDISAVECIPAVAQHRRQGDVRTQPAAVRGDQGDANTGLVENCSNPCNAFQCNPACFTDVCARLPQHLPQFGPLREHAGKFVKPAKIRRLHAGGAAAGNAECADWFTIAVPDWHPGHERQGQPAGPWQDGADALVLTGIHDQQRTCLADSVGDRRETAGQLRAGAAGCISNPSARAIGQGDPCHRCIEQARRKPGASLDGRARIGNGDVQRIEPRPALGIIRNKWWFGHDRKERICGFVCIDNEWQ